MNLHLSKTNIERDGVVGMSIELRTKDGLIGGADLRLPADEQAVATIIDTLGHQAERHGVRLNGRQKLALAQSIEMGAVQ